MDVRVQSETVKFTCSASVVNFVRESMISAPLWGLRPRVVLSKAPLYPAYFAPVKRYDEANLRLGILAVGSLRSVTVKWGRSPGLCEMPFKTPTTYSGTNTFKGYCIEAPSSSTSIRNDLILRVFCRQSLLAAVMKELVNLSRHACFQINPQNVIGRVVAPLLLFGVLPLGCEDNESRDETAFGDGTQIVSLIDRIAARKEWGGSGELEGAKVRWNHEGETDRAAGLQLDLALRKTPEASVVDTVVKGPQDPVHFIVSSGGRLYHVKVANGFISLKPTVKDDASLFVRD